MKFLESSNISPFKSSTVMKNKLSERYFVLVLNGFIYFKGITAAENKYP